ncbi:hypothetical protein NEDG_01235 [Nematocida displodere]|uniref:Uncharacterized protein n=1 Tax=Nematocida displodere TaxID=1805483 RepID=A0A177EBJ0_9MICR|nr:hypothetical protein NEDG_01235 [Nematocida displodere]
MQVYNFLTLLAFIATISASTIEAQHSTKEQCKITGAINSSAFVVVNACNLNMKVAKGECPVYAKNPNPNPSPNTLAHPEASTGTDLAPGSTTAPNIPSESNPAPEPAPRPSPPKMEEPNDFVLDEGSEEEFPLSTPEPSLRRRNSEYDDGCRSRETEAILGEIYEMTKILTAHMDRSVENAIHRCHSLIANERNSPRAEYIPR